MGQAVNILGVEFYPVTKTSAERTLDWMLSRDDGRTRLVVTANPIMVMSALCDPEFMAILERADLLVPDGVGILWAARRIGRPLPERVTGADLTQYLLGRRPAPRLFLLGGKPGVAEKAYMSIEKKMPGARVCGTHHGYFDASEDACVVDAIRASRPDVVLVGMGSPRQEKFVWNNRARLGAKMAMGVGGVLDILAGEAKRAPYAVQKTGLEWLYRLIREPKRFRADVKLMEFFLKVQFDPALRKSEAQKGEESGEDEHI